MNLVQLKVWCSLLVSFSDWIAHTNESLKDLDTAISSQTKLEAAISVCTQVIQLLTNETVENSESIIGNSVLALPNSDRFDSWFHDHPDFEGIKSAFSLLDENSLTLQAKLYWLKKRSNALMAGAVHFTPNWEDAEWSRSSSYKMGIDFFLSPDSKSVHVVLSNLGKLRVLEISKRLTNTDVEIFENWYDLPVGASVEAIHSEIWNSFRLQSLNSRFYSGIADAFVDLYTSLVEGGKPEKESKLFAARLLGRMIFVRFLEKMNLVDSRMDYFTIGNRSQLDFYQNSLENLFYGVLNTPIDSRNAENFGTLDTSTPYLNGGLFSCQEDDWLGEKLNFPSEFFSRLFDHFNDFNFTTDESTPDYEQIAIDPEMLGRVFESLLASQVESTGEQARKAKGAFYTPREIVAFMCKQALREHLVSQHKNEHKVLQSIAKLLDKSDHDWANDGSNSLRDIPKEHRDVISQTLKNVKTLDPACGSGAFPLGLLQLLHNLHLRLNPSLDAYRLKLDILQNNIYGSDIEPMAIEISKLRSWLSLIVSGSDRHEVEPLPNLEFNFVAANSLLTLQVGDLFTDEQVEIDLQDLRNKYFSESKALNKKRIQEKYLKLTHQDLFDERSNQLRTFNPFDSDSVAKFFDPDIMFGISDGFDVIVGNPPYIGEKGHKDLFSTVRNSDLGVRFYQGKMDYFYFFFHLGLDLLKSKGILCLITTNYYVTATYASKLVDDIQLRTQPLLFLNFNEIRLFESATGQHNLISLLQKEGSSRECVIVNALSTIAGKVSPEELDEVLKFNPEFTSKAEKKPSELFDLSQIRLMSSSSSEENSILELMAKSGFQLGQAYDIRQGVLTGADRVSNSHAKSHPHLADRVGAGIFIITPEELAAMSLDQHELEIVKPFFKNSAIRPYMVDTKNKFWIIYADKKEQSLNSRTKLRDYLKQFEAVIASSSDNSPYLHRPRNFNFDKDSIVVPQRSSKNTFALAEHPFYSSADVYFIAARDESPYSLSALTGMLNSSIYYKWLYFRGKRKGEYLELFQVPLTQLPLPKPTAKNIALAKSIEEKVKSIRLILSSESGESIEVIEEQISSDVQSMFEA